MATNGNRNGGLSEARVRRLERCCERLEHMIDKVRSLEDDLHNRVRAGEKRIGELEARCTRIENAGDALIDAADSMRDHINELEASTTKAIADLTRRVERLS